MPRDRRKAQAAAPPARQQASWCPDLLALQAQLAGLELSVRGEEPQLTQPGWAQLIRTIEVACLPESMHGTEAALLRARPGECLVAKKPSASRVIASGDLAWLHGGSFSGRDGYWQWAFKNVPKAEWTEVQQALHTRLTDEQDLGEWARIERSSGLRGRVQKSQLERAKATKYTKVHHIICWWYRGRPPGSGYDVACHVPCGNKRCLNPHHIEWASKADNNMHRAAHADIRAKVFKGPVPVHGNYTSHVQKQEEEQGLGFKARQRLKKKGKRYGQGFC